MAKSVRLTGDKNTGLGKFSVYESVGDVDESKHVFDESIAVTERYDAEFLVPASVTDYEVDMSEVFDSTPVKKLLVYCASALSVKLSSPANPSLTMSGVSVLGTDVRKLYFSNAGVAAVKARVLAGG